MIESSVTRTVVGGCVMCSAWCVSSPSTTYVQISMSRCGCAPKPRDACTRSSFITRKTPKLAFRGFEYSANEKWKRLFSQFEFVHVDAPSIGSPKNFCSFGGLPNS